MTRSSLYTPYRIADLDLEYNRLFCDNIKLFRQSRAQYTTPEWQSLFAQRPNLETILEISSNSDLPAQLRILAFNYLLAKNCSPHQKELLGCIIEAGEKDGLDTLAAYTDYHMVYIDSTGHKKEWSNLKSPKREALISLFRSCADLAAHLKPTDQPRFVPPFAGMVRITLLLSDGRYFGQGPANHLSKDELSGPLIRKAKRLLAELLAQEESL
jgi:hypothetical protein